MLSIINAQYKGGYSIELEFSDGKKGLADLSELVLTDPRPIFLPLKDQEFFKNFKIDYTLVWSEEIDLAPEYLFYLTFKNDTKLREKFLNWGYCK